MLLPVVAESLRWHATGGARTADAILNTCRAFRFSEEDVWSSKPEAGRWALERLERPDAVVAALDYLSGGAEPAEADARPFVSLIARRLADARS
jgi:Aminoglycoside adenylyltransferase, C-terminal domain